MTGLREHLLIGCGNPLLDISANVDTSLLQKYNLKANDAILADETHTQLYKDLVEKYDAEYIAGGSVQNTLRVCQWVLRTPGIATFFGCVGKDNYAKILTEKATNDGLNVRYQHVNKTPTGTCAVLITGTQRSLCANLAAANHFTIDHLRIPENRAILEQGQYFYISGFFLTVSPSSIMEIAEYAYSHQRTFMMNLSAPFIATNYVGPLMDVMPYIDILFGNGEEAEAFADTQGWETKNRKIIGEKMANLPKQNEKQKRIVIITNGAASILLCQGGTVSEYRVPRLSIRDIVDTNGAGDAFVGGFIAQYVQKNPLMLAFDVVLNVHNIS